MLIFAIIITIKALQVWDVKHWPQQKHHLKKKNSLHGIIKVKQNAKQGAYMYTYGWCIYVYLWHMHVDVWQKPIQYYKATMLQLKINKFFKKHKTHTSSKYLREYGRKFRKVTVG